MGSRDDDELIVDDQALADAELQTRRLLGRWGEPAAAEPPPALSAQVMAALAGRPRRSRRPRPWLPALALLVGALGLALGIWGVFGSSLDVAALFGGPAAPLGRLLLAAVLLTKPLVNLLVSGAVVAPIGVGTALLTMWLWWRIVRVGPGPEVL